MTQQSWNEHCKELEDRDASFRPKFEKWILSIGSGRSDALYRCRKDGYGDWQTYTDGTVGTAFMAWRYQAMKIQSAVDEEREACEKMAIKRRDDALAAGQGTLSEWYRAIDAVVSDLRARGK